MLYLYNRNKGHYEDKSYDIGFKYNILRHNFTWKY